VQIDFDKLDKDLDLYSTYFPSLEGRLKGRE
jgi:hypothetical protein